MWRDNSIKSINKSVFYVGDEMFRQFHIQSKLSRFRMLTEFDSSTVVEYRVHVQFVRW